jgi:2-methylcitrate dehydratase PrpD
MTGPNPTRALADFVVRTRLEDVPERTRDRAKLILVDAVANAYAGRQADDTARITALSARMGAFGDSPVIGGEPLSAAAAVLLNGYLVTATTVCDVYLPALCHITPEVLPPTIAVGVRDRASGRDLLLAFALGLELTTRISAGSGYPAFRARGWHSPGVFGPFGGAAAAGKLLGLDVAGMTNALGLAGSQAAGTFAHWGTPTIKFHQARGALSGFLAATLAAEDFASASDVLTASDGGLYNAYSDGGRVDEALEGLGERWELEQISLRQWPLASSLQATATALFALLDDPRLAIDQIADVRIGLGRIPYQMHGEIGWATRFEALLSARYVSAVILHDRACWLDQFTTERLMDEALHDFAVRKISVVLDESVAATGTAVTITLVDGQVLRERRPTARGEPADPLSMDDVTAKFIRAVGPGAAPMLDRLKHIENVPAADAELFGSVG